MKINCYTLLLLCLLFSVNLKGQVHCSETLVTTVPTINTWDWRTQYWTVNAYTNGGPGVITSVLSPFYNVDNINLNEIAGYADKDYKPEDGWELIKRNLGNSGETPTNNAYVVFYNKYTSKIRVFFLVTQTFSNVGANGANAQIKISFLDTDPYQSNLLTTYSTPLLPLDQVKRDIDIRTPNIYYNQLPYWLYSEFPVAYDPCTCGKIGNIRIELTLLEAETLEFDLNSVPYQKTIANGQIDTGTDWLTSFSKFSESVEGGLNVTRSTGKAFDKLNTGIEKQTNLDLKAKLLGDNQKIKGVVDAIGSWGDLIPVAGSVVKSVTSLIDFFAAGGKTSTSTAGPAPVMIMNNFKAKGSITSTVFKNEITLAIPGSNQTGVEPAKIPTYNNILGSINLLTTPSVTVKSKFNYTFVPGGHCNNYLYNREYWINVNSPIKFAINPALNIDLSQSSIKASFVVEGSTLAAGATNLQTEIEQGGKPVYRSSYFPLGSISEGTGYLRYDGQGCINPLYFTFTPIGTIYLKVVAKLHPSGATSPTQDIYLIVKYPVAPPTVITTTETFASGPEDLPEDLTIPENGSVLVQAKALNTLTASSFTVSNPGSPNTGALYAGEAIIVKAGAVLTPNITLRVGPQYIYSPSAPTLQSLRVTSAELASFCGGSGYNTTGRNSPAARIAAEEIEVIPKEKFFAFYPNPTSDQVTFKYFIEERSSVTLNIVDVSGKIVAQLIDDYKDMGDYAYQLNTSGLPAGLYIVRFASNKLSRTEKLVVIR